MTLKYWKLNNNELHGIKISCSKCLIILVLVIMVVKLLREDRLYKITHARLDHAEHIVWFITFIFACIMSCAICVGMMLAIGAGIAYGYNLSLAEFLDFTRSDVTVYVRRGQFHDNPYVHPLGRRSGDDNDVFSSNFSVDYQDGQKGAGESKPLADAWQRAQDSKNYAERLTKYSNIQSPNFRSGAVDEDEIAAMNISARKEDEVEPNRATLPGMSIEITSNNSSDQDDSLATYTTRSSDAADYNDESDRDTRHHNFKIYRRKGKKSKKPSVKVRVEVPDEEKSFPLIRSTKVPSDYSEDVEYSNIFKPV